MEDMCDKVVSHLTNKDGHINLTEVHEEILERYVRQSKFTPYRAPCHPGDRNRWLLCACSRWVRPPLYNATVRYTVSSNRL